MALMALSNAEIGERVAWLRRTADWRTARDLAVEMDEKDLGIFTKLDKGVSLSPQRIVSIARLCAGRGNVVDDIDTVLGFLHGVKDEGDVFRPRLRLVGEGQPDSNSNGGSPDLRVRDASLIDHEAA